MLPIAATVASMALLAVFAARHFPSARAAALALALFATMPVVWIAAAGGAPQIVLVPLVLVPLISVDRFHRAGGWQWLALAGGALALMPYAHLAGVVMAPVYLALCALILLSRADRIGSIAALIAGFAIVVLPWLVGVLRDPQLLTAPIMDYGLYDAERFNFAQGIKEMASWTGLTVRSEMYWESFNPARLFFGSGTLGQSLIASKVFLLPLALPLALGFVEYVLRPRDAIDRLVLGAFVVSPAAAALIAQPLAPRLILMAAPAAIIAARGCYPVLAGLARLRRRPLPR